MSQKLAPKSLFVLDSENFVRKPLVRLIRLPMFDWFMLLTICANSVTLAMSPYNKPGFAQSDLGIAMQRANYVFISMFAAEALCKIIALGFVFAQYTYLRDGACSLLARMHAEGAYHILTLHSHTRAPR